MKATHQVMVKKRGKSPPPGRGGLVDRGLVVITVERPAGTKNEGKNHPLIPPNVCVFQLALITIFVRKKDTSV